MSFNINALLFVLEKIAVKKIRKNITTYSFDELPIAVINYCDVINVFHFQLSFAKTMLA